MASTTLTVPVTRQLSQDLDKLATAWGYRAKGHGGKTGFVSELLERIVDNHQQGEPDFQLQTVLPQKSTPKK
uniref:Uncharacterized protein n=1 Tax=Vibrio sp. 23023 TaxID=452803 RepID=A9M4M7_9VIBR|nr:hypothetical protein [Vibrio sp. 23023]ABX76998.1 Conserved hypothetical protein [Vibrio sp. 23023]